MQVAVEARLRLGAAIDMPCIEACRHTAHHAVVQSNVVHVIADHQLACSWRFPAKVALASWIVPDQACTRLVVLCTNGSLWMLRDASCSNITHGKRPRYGYSAQPSRVVKPVDCAASIDLPALGHVRGAIRVPDGLVVWFTAGMIRHLPLLPLLESDQDHRASLARMTSERCPFLESLLSERPPIVVAVHQITDRVAETPNISASAALDPSLHCALYGMSSDASSHALLAACTDACGELYCFGLSEIKSQVVTMHHLAAREPIAVLGQGAVALFTYRKSPGSGRPRETSAPDQRARGHTHAVAVGAKGALLVLSVNRDGSLRRQLWQLTAQSVIGACICKGHLVTLTPGGAFSHVLDMFDDGQSPTEAIQAEAAARELMLAERVADVIASRPSVTEAPDAEATPLSLAPPPLAVADASLDSDIAAEPFRFVALDSTGVLSVLNAKVVSPQAASDQETGRNSAFDSTECFLSTYTERCLRERLRKVGESSDALSRQKERLSHAETVLTESVSAHGIIAAAVDGGMDLFRVSLSDDASSLHIEVHNPSSQPFAEPWSAVIQLSRTNASHDSYDDEHGRYSKLGDHVASCKSHSVDSISRPLGGLPGRGTWVISMPLPASLLHMPLEVHVHLLYNADWLLNRHATLRLGLLAGQIPGLPFSMVSTASALVQRTQLLPHALLRRRSSWPPVPHADYRLQQALYALRTQHVVAKTPTNNHVGQFRLRLFLRGTCGTQVRHNTQAAADWLYDLLRNTAALGGKRNLFSTLSTVTHGAKQANISLELPSGVDVNMRLGMDHSVPTTSGAPTNHPDSTSKNTALQMFVQCARPCHLWSLRTSILQALAARLFFPTDEERGKIVQGAIEADAEKVSRATMQEVERMQQDTHHFASQLRRWHLVHTELHAHIVRCYDMRWRFDGASGGVSLRDLSHEVREQAIRMLELHEKLRENVGCLQLPVKPLE